MGRYKMTKTKSDWIRELNAKGLKSEEILQLLKVTPKYLREVLDPKYCKKARGWHSKGEPFKPRPVHSGTCVKYTVIDGVAVQCGAKCKRQLCDEHAESTLPIAHQWIRSNYGGVIA